MCWKDKELYVKDVDFFLKMYNVKVTLHLQLLQNIGFIPHVIQYTL